MVTQCSFPVNVFSGIIKVEMSIFSIESGYEVTSPPSFLRGASVAWRRGNPLFKSGWLFTMCNE